MFEISDEAMELILVRLEAAIKSQPAGRPAGPRVGLRLNFREGGAHLSLASPRPTDRVMTFMGRTLLIIDPVDFSHLERTRLTMERALDGNRLALEPNSLEQAA